jgi:hypothetical protein
MSGTTNRSHETSFASRIVAGTGRLRDRLRVSVVRGQLGPSRESDLRAFLPRH